MSAWEVFKPPRRRQPFVASEGRRRSPARGSYHDLTSLEQVRDRLGDWHLDYAPGDYTLLIISGLRHLFFRDPYGGVRHAVCKPDEGWLIEHRDRSVSAGPWIPSSRGGWEGWLAHGVWIARTLTAADRERLTALPSALKLGALPTRSALSSLTSEATS